MVSPDSVVSVVCSCSFHQIIFQNDGGHMCIIHISAYIYICMYMDGHPTRAYLEHFSVVFAVNKPLVLLFIFSFYLYTASQVQYLLALAPFLLQFLNNKCTDCTFKHIFSTQKLRTKHYHKPIRSCFYSEVLGYNLVPCNSHAIPMQFPCRIIVTV